MNTFFKLKKYGNFSGTVVSGVQHRPFLSLLGNSVFSVLYCYSRFYNRPRQKWPEYHGDTCFGHEIGHWPTIKLVPESPWYPGHFCLGLFYNWSFSIGQKFFFRHPVCWSLHQFIQLVMFSMSHAILSWPTPPTPLLVYVYKNC